MKTAHRSPKTSKVKGRAVDKSSAQFHGIVLKPSCARDYQGTDMYDAPRRAIDIGGKMSPELLAFRNEHEPEFRNLHERYNILESLYRFLEDYSRMVVRRIENEVTPMPKGVVPREYAIDVAVFTGRNDVAGRILFDNENRSPVIIPVQTRNAKGPGSSIYSVDRGHAATDYEASRCIVKKFQKKLFPLPSCWEQKYPKIIYNWHKVLDSANRKCEQLLRRVFVLLPNNLRKEYAEYYGAPDLLVKIVTNPNGFMSKKEAQFREKTRDYNKKENAKLEAKYGPQGFLRYKREAHHKHTQKKQMQQLEQENALACGV